MSGGFIVPDAFIDDVGRVLKARSWFPMSDEMWEDMGYPPRWKGLAYWHRRERQAVWAHSIRGRLTIRARRFRWLIEDMPRRLTNARAALGGAWEASDDD